MWDLRQHLPAASDVAETLIFRRKTTNRQVICDAFPGRAAVSNWKRVWKSLRHWLEMLLKSHFLPRIPLVTALAAT